MKRYSYKKSYTKLNQEPVYQTFIDPLQQELYELIHKEFHKHCTFERTSVSIFFSIDYFVDTTYHYDIRVSDRFHDMDSRTIHRYLRQQFAQAGIKYRIINAYKCYSDSEQLEFVGFIVIVKAARKANIRYISC